MPDSQTRKLAVVAEGERVEVLGRTDETSYGRWLFVRTGEQIKGFVYEPVFEYTVAWDALPVQEPEAVVLDRELSVSPGPLKIERIWPAGVCNEGGGWTAYFEVKVWGGDGKDYRFFWEGEPVQHVVKATERDVAVIQLPGVLPRFLGTISVESGGQRVGKAIDLRKPDKCD